MINKRRICLAMPTNRACAEGIEAIVREANFAVHRCGVEVILLIADTAADDALVINKQAVLRQQTLTVPGVKLIHLDREQQFTILHNVTRHLSNGEKIVQQLLPRDASYGAATNRLFIFAESYGCDSVHRRDSDSGYQTKEGEEVFPIEHEIAFAKLDVLESSWRVEQSLSAQHLPEQPIYISGASFVGERSVDVEPLLERSESAFYDVLGLMCPLQFSQQQKQLLVQNAFSSKATAFEKDKVELVQGQAVNIDMCNICFTDIYRLIPLPNCSETIGADYFYLQLMKYEKLTFVQHNRHIDNFYTPERRTVSGRVIYQLRLVNYLLYMSFNHALFAYLKQSGQLVLNVNGGAAPANEVLLQAIKAVQPTLSYELKQKLDLIIAAYEPLGDEFTQTALFIKQSQQSMINKVLSDINAFADLVEIWPTIISNIQGNLEIAA
ncbi:DUF6271 family protein [Motilimonas sp. E26]|uniref:DUF6271 family protein n=1 Tax=Motilimonas TaxID=1914248 RepID=UPI001E494440|nr:DUF6271 family protein [Motilimonas sp. E26]MCE0556405.1 hypothetical protein [Motilimonas sp. E26]